MAIHLDQEKPKSTFLLFEGNSEQSPHTTWHPKKDLPEQTFHVDIEWLIHLLSHSLTSKYLSEWSFRVPNLKTLLFDWNF